MSHDDSKNVELRRAALEYHEFPTPGKIAIAATKQMVNQHDLALAYSPGVAAACEEIVADPANAYRYTAKGNLVAVSPTARRCSVWATSARWQPNR